MRLAMCYVRDSARVAAVIKSERRFSFVCWRGFFLFCFLWGRLAWLVGVFFSFSFFFDLVDMIAKFCFLQKIL